MNTIAAIPAYNEEVTIGSVVLKSRKYVDKVIVIDDGSIDSTSEVARLAGAEVIRHPTNVGKGLAIKTAFSEAKKANADILVLLDGDCQHNPDDIPALLEAARYQDADMVIGSRFMAGGTKLPAYRRLGQIVLDISTSLSITKHCRITDTQSGFRVLSKRTISSLDLEDNDFGVESEMIIDAVEQGLKIKEVPIGCRYDVDGSTKHPITHGFSVFGKIINFISNRRPMLFFSVLGLCSSITGFLLGVNVYTIIKTTGELASGTALLSTLFMITGILSIFTGIILNSVLINKKEIKEFLRSD